MTPAHVGVFLIANSLLTLFHMILAAHLGIGHFNILVPEYPNILDSHYTIGVLPD